MKKSPARNVHLKKGPSKLLEKINSSIDIDARLYKEDIEGSIAHTRMLMKTKIITSNDGKKIISALNQILQNIEKGKVHIEKGFEELTDHEEATIEVELEEEEDHMIEEMFTTVGKKPVLLN